MEQQKPHSRCNHCGSYIGISAEDQIEAIAILEANGYEFQSVGDGIFKVSYPKKIKILKGSQERVLGYFSTSKLFREAERLKNEPVKKKRRRRAAKE
jgi:hypothetical protein